MSFSERVLTPALEGLCAWLAFIAVENVFLVVVPYVIHPRHMFASLSFYFSVLEALVCALAGVICGIAASYIWPRLPRPAIRAIGTVSFLAVYAALSVPYLRLQRTSQLGMVLALMLIAGAIISLQAGKLARLARPLGNPWVSAACLFGPSSLMFDYFRESSRLKTAGAAGGFLIAAIVIGELILRRLEKPGPVISYRWATVSLATLTVGASIAAVQIPLEQPSSQAVASAGKPNVLLVVMDTVRADRLSVYGYQRDTTPRLAEFAKDAIVYKNSFSAGNMTLASHASIFTGLYPFRHGAHFRKGHLIWGSPLSPSHTTLTEALAGQGYDTTAVVANAAYLTTSFGFGQGFAHYDQRPATPMFDRGLRAGGQAREYSFRFRLRGMVVRFLKPRQYEQLTRRASEINHEVFRHLTRIKRQNKPFFLFVNYMDAHVPYLPPDPFQNKYPGIDERVTLDEYYHHRDALLIKPYPVPARLQQHVQSQYDGALSYLDFEIGGLLDRLKELGLYDNTLIIITSDHGESLGERNRLEHGTSVYSEQVKVPLIVRYPTPMGQPVGESRTELASGVDLLPTVFDVVGLPQPAKVEGISLLKHTPGALPRPVFAESYRRSWSGKESELNTERTVILDKWKLVSPVSGRCELFELDKDPGEQHNICDQHEKVARELAGLLRSFAGKAGSQNSSMSADEPGHSNLEVLKSLGYVQ